MQKTACEMRMSDWRSDVCSSDLVGSQNPGKIGGRTLELEPDGLRIGRADAKLSHRRDLIDRPSALQHIEIGGVTRARLGVHQPAERPDAIRSEERPGGKECVSTCNSRWPPHA